MLNMFEYYYMIFVSIERAREKDQDIPKFREKILIIHQKVMSTSPIIFRYEFVKIQYNYGCNTQHNTCMHARTAT